MKLLDEYFDKGGGGMGDLKGNFAFDYESIIYAAKGKPHIREKRYKFKLTARRTPWRRG